MINNAPILKQLFVGYPNVEISEGTVAIYIRLLADIPASDLQTIVDQCLAECKFLPTVAELRERHRSLTVNYNQLTAAEAWGLVLSEIRRIGSYGSPQFTDGKTSQVVKMMGWRELCASEQPGVDRAQFMRMYEQLAGRDDQEQRLLPQSRALIAERRGLLPAGQVVAGLLERGGRAAA